MNVTVAGLPVRFYYDASGDLVQVAFQTVTYNGSPLIVTFDPPIAGVDQFNLPDTVNAILMNALIAALLGGAHIGG